ncbi:DUF1127 domain-containing protein [Eionea flava]
MKALISQFVSLFNRVAQNRTAKELLNMSDSRLTDIGLSRFKLEQGSAGYPWKLEVNAVVLDFVEAKKLKVSDVQIIPQSQGQVAA